MPFMTFSRQCILLRLFDDFTDLQTAILAEPRVVWKQALHVHALKLRQITVVKQVLDA